MQNLSFSFAWKIFQWVKLFSCQYSSHKVQIAVYRLMKFISLQVFFRIYVSNDLPFTISDYAFRHLYGPYFFYTHSHFSVSNMRYCLQAFMTFQWRSLTWKLLIFNISSSTFFSFSCMYFHINFTSSIVKIISDETARYSIGVMSGFLPP